MCSKQAIVWHRKLLYSDIVKGGGITCGCTRKFRPLTYVKGFPSAFIHHADTKYKVRVADCVARGEQQSPVQAGLYTAAVLSAPSGCVYGHTALHDILMPFKHGCALFSTPTYQQCPCFKAHCHPSLTLWIYTLTVFLSFSNYTTQQTLVAHQLYLVILCMNISSKRPGVMEISTRLSGDKKVSEQFTVNFINQTNAKCQMPNHDNFLHCMNNEWHWEHVCYTKMTTLLSNLKLLSSIISSLVNWCSHMWE